LQRFEGAQLCKRRTTDELSAAELECLRRAKSNFENRLGLAREIIETIRSDIDKLACWSQSLYNMRDLVSYQRATEIMGDCVRLLCREADVGTVNRLVTACRALDQARESDRYRALRHQWWDFCKGTLAAPLLDKLQLVSVEDDGNPDYRYGRYRPAIPLAWELDEKKIAVAQEIISQKQHPAGRFVDQFVLPREVPWSSRQRAERLIRGIAGFCNAEVMKEIRSQFGTIASILEKAMGQDTGLKGALLRESLTGEKFSVPLRRRS
jgi:hypothetical protein